MKTIAAFLLVVAILACAQPVSARGGRSSGNDCSADSSDPDCPSAEKGKTGK